MDNKRKNYAPKSQEGWYTVHVVDNEVKIIKNCCGPLIAMGEKDKKVTVRCHPDDRFNIGKAINIGIERMEEKRKEINIGDKVKIVNGGNSLSTYTNWPEEYMRYAIRFRYGVCPNEGIICKVVGKFKNNDGNMDMFIIQPVVNEYYLGNSKYTNLLCYDCVYLLSDSGLEKVR